MRYKSTIDFSNYSVDELEKYITKNWLHNPKDVRWATLERQKKLNKDFVMDETFIACFITLNNRLTALMNEMYDKMKILKNGLTELMNSNTSLYKEFELESYIYYEEFDAELGLMEIMFDEKYKSLYQISMSSYDEPIMAADEDQRKEKLMSDLNWNIEIFNKPEIKERNIWVCYFMHVLFCDGDYALSDIFKLKPECFHLNFQSNFDFEDEKID